MDLGALVGESRCLRPEALLVDVGHDDAHALAGEGFDDGQPDAAGRAGHDGRPALEMLHGAPMVPGTPAAPRCAPAPPARRRWWASWSGVADSTDESPDRRDRPSVPVLTTRTGGARLAAPETHQVDEEGELLSVPFPLSFLWLVLGVLTVLEALNDLFGFAGPHWLYDNWIHNVVLGICAVLVLARAAYEPIARQGLAGVRDGAAAVVRRQRRLVRGLRRATSTRRTRPSRTSSGWPGTRWSRSGCSI